MPGGLVQLNESLDSAVKRILRKKADTKGIYLKQLYSFGNPERNKGGYIISVACFTLVNGAKFGLCVTYYKLNGTQPEIALYSLRSPKDCKIWV
ncbi:NUDIX hydrolase [Candidatus Parcubacteria bacterium]|nr:MAG: NUDIX hydrolase [Candidatus Parcubacteria bacterium]